MILSLCSILAMTGMFLYMFNKAVLTSTRKMALLPLLCAVIEGGAAGAVHGSLAAGALTPSLFPGLTAVLVVLRLAILLCCAGAMRRDAAAARRRERNRRRRAAEQRAEAMVTLPVARLLSMAPSAAQKGARPTAGRCA